MSEKAYYCIANQRNNSVVVLEFNPCIKHPWYSNSKIEALEFFIQKTLEILHAAQDRLDGELFLEATKPASLDYKETAEHKTNYPEGWGDCSAIKAPDCPNNVCANH